MAIVQLLRSDLYRLVSGSGKPEGNLYESPGGVRVLVAGDHNDPRVTAWTASGAVLFDVEHATADEIDGRLP